MLIILGTIALTLITLSLLAEWERRQHKKQRVQQARRDMIRHQQRYTAWHDPNRPAWSPDAQLASRERNRK
jgi:hypothetical protein